MNIEEDKGFSGIKNLGNTCFLNSCIQILSHTYELNIFIDNFFSTPPSENCDEISGEDLLLTKEYIDLIRLIWDHNCIITPMRFLNVVQSVARIKNREIFTGFAQNDATEFLQFLIDCLENACSNNEILKRDIEHLFYGKLISTISKFCGVKDVEKSKFCGVEDVEKCSIKDVEPPSIVSKQSEPFFILNIPIPSAPQNFDNNGEIPPPPTIYDCIAKFTDCEVLDGENKWYNEKTKEYESVIKKYDFDVFPQILVITLKRFNHTDKNEVLVIFGEMLEFSGGSAAAAEAQPIKYELYGVCNHFGNAVFGHYTAFVKHNSGQWIHFNDHIVEKVSEFSNVISPNAYCLFYRKRQ